MNLRMILVEALTVARRPFLVVAKRFALEKSHEVRQTSARQRVNLDGGGSHGRSMAAAAIYDPTFDGTAAR